MTDESTRLNRRNVLKGLGGIGAVGAAGGIGLAAFAGGAAAASSFIDISGTSIANDEGDVDYVTVDVSKTIEWQNFDVPLRYIGFKHEITLVNSTIDGSVGWHPLYTGSGAEGDVVSGRLTDWRQSAGSCNQQGGCWGGPDEYVIDHSNKDHKGNNPEASEYTTGAAHAGVLWAIISDGSHPIDHDSVQSPVDWTPELSVDNDGDGSDVTKDRVVKWRTTLVFYTENDNGDPVQITEDDGVPYIEDTEEFTVSVTNETGSNDGTEATGSSTVA